MVLSLVKITEMKQQRLQGMQIVALNSILPLSTSPHDKPSFARRTRHGTLGVAASVLL